MTDRRNEWIDSDCACSKSADSFVSAATRVVRLRMWGYPGNPETIRTTDELFKSQPRLSTNLRPEQIGKNRIFNRKRLALSHIVLIIFRINRKSNVAFR